MKKYHFSMILSEANIFKLLPMYASLAQYCRDFELFILCMNNSVYEILSKIGFENITLKRVEDLEKDNKDMRIAKSNRTFHEYCWTSKSIFLDYLINNYTEAEYYVHVDADLFFFSNVDAIFDEDPEASIILIDHRNSQEFMNYYDLSGRFNTGFVGFKNDDEGKAAIKLWVERCLVKCTAEYDTVNKTFGDQRYVEDWVDIFKNVHVVESIGADTAFWNVKNYKFSKDKDQVYVDDSPLIFYHFCAFIILSPREFDLCCVYTILDEQLLDLVYEPYVRGLAYGIDAVKKAFPWFNSTFVFNNQTYDYKNYKFIM